MLTFHAIGDWLPDQVHITWVPSSWLCMPEIQRLIDQAWAEASARPGVLLFDGPMCRMESWRAGSERLELVLSRTSYKPFLGTNLHHPELAEQYGAQALANPAGVSPALLSRDGYLMLGRRNDAVAYYPGRIHPFSGSLEPYEPLDIFAEVRRELAEELNMGGGDLSDLRCAGIVEDHRLRQPELIFLAEATKTRAQIETQLDAAEHRETWSVRATPEAIERVLCEERALTPVATAALLLWGRRQWGEAWFHQSRHFTFTAAAHTFRA